MSFLSTKSSLVLNLFSYEFDDQPLTKFLLYQPLIVLITNNISLTPFDLLSTLLLNRQDTKSLDRVDTMTQ